jgi:hypothetical protein
MSARHDTLLDEEGVRLIVEHAGSVLHLETLLLVWESSGASWSVGQLAARTYVGEEQARSIGHDLERKGLLVEARPGQFAVTADPAGREIAGRIAALYRSNVLRVAGLLHAAPAASARNVAPRQEPKDR